MRAPLVLLILSVPAAAQDAPSLAFPVECTLGETCMIQQLMDRDPGPDAQDFLCGPMTYDEHRGTDIRVPDMEDLAQGMRILASAPGTVIGARNSVPDLGSDDFPEGQDCGNGVVIDHADEWQTQYCHMAQGSVLVEVGDEVEAGQPIGEMGFSGDTTFPHLHLSVRQNGNDVDPFDPSTNALCGESADPLWAESFTPSPGGILSVGFADAIPEFEAIRAGVADVDALTINTAALVVWGFLYGGRADDTVRIEITAPDGSTYHVRDITLERTQAELFRATGRRNRIGLAPGDYTGTVTLIRNGTSIDRENAVVSIN